MSPAHKILNAYLMIVLLNMLNMILKPLCLQGFTMFGQRRITDKLFGTPYTCLEAETGLALLRQHIDYSGEVQF